MSRLSLTVLKHLPIGLWLIVVWCALQSALLLAVSVRVDGNAASAALASAAVQMALAAGMLMRLRWVRGALIVYLAASLFAGTIAVAVLALLYTYVGLAEVETLIAGLAVICYTFMVWAFFYLFHPNLTDVFEWHWAQNLADSHAPSRTVPAAA
jgi:hypothetical protein